MLYHMNIRISVCLSSCSLVINLSNIQWSRLEADDFSSSPLQSSLHTGAVTRTAYLPPNFLKQILSSHGTVAFPLTVPPNASIRTIVWWMNSTIWPIHGWVNRPSWSIKTQRWTHLHSGYTDNEIYRWQGKAALRGTYVKQKKLRVYFL